MKSDHSAAIRKLNDQLRQDFTLGVAVLTVGIANLGAQAVQRIVRTIATYDDFTQFNNPHNENDFGAFEADGAKIFFKIDYYDKTMKNGSPDPSDPLVTTRVITIMLADEY